MPCSGERTELGLGGRRGRAKVRPSSFVRACSGDNGGGSGFKGQGEFEVDGRKQLENSSRSIPHAHREGGGGALLRGNPGRLPPIVGRTASAKKGWPKGRKEWQKNRKEWPKGRKVWQKNRKERPKSERALHLASNKVEFLPCSRRATPSLCSSRSAPCVHVTGGRSCPADLPPAHRRTLSSFFFLCFPLQASQPKLAAAGTR